MTLPDTGTLSAAGLTPETIGSAETAKLEAAARSAGGVGALAGALVWNGLALGCVARWRLAAPGQARTWGVRGVNFDEAFRNGMRGAAQILTSTGHPK